MILYFNLIHIKELIVEKNNGSDEAIVKSILSHSLKGLGYTTDVETLPITKPSHHEVLDLVDEYLGEKLSNEPKENRIELIPITPYYYKAIFY